MLKRNGADVRHVLLATLGQAASICPRIEAGLKTAAPWGYPLDVQGAYEFLSEKSLLCWANVADRMRIKGISREYAELLRAAGVDTVKELKYRNPCNLAKAMAAANKKHKMVRLLPSEQVVARWIDRAQKLPLKISY
ncbi:MAG: DUF4332 domain-containing protein [Pseudolabrys sp.]